MATSKISAPHLVARDQGFAEWYRDYWEYTRIQVHMMRIEGLLVLDGLNEASNPLLSHGLKADGIYQPLLPGYFGQLQLRG